MTALTAQLVVTDMTRFAPDAVLVDLRELRHHVIAEGHRIASLAS